MFYLIGILTIALPCQLGRGQVEKNRGGSWSVRSSIWAHTQGQSSALCVTVLGAQAIWLQPWVLSVRQRHVEITRPSADGDNGLQRRPAVWTSPWSMLGVDGEGT